MYIVDFPIEAGCFHSSVNVYQRVYPVYPVDYHCSIHYYPLLITINNHYEPLFIIFTNISESGFQGQHHGWIELRGAEMFKCGRVQPLTPRAAPSRHLVCPKIDMIMGPIIGWESVSKN